MGKGTSIIVDNTLRQGDGVWGKENVYVLIVPVVHGIIYCSKQPDKTQEKINTLFMESVLKHPHELKLIHVRAVPFLIEGGGMQSQNVVGEGSKFCCRG